MEEYTLSDTEIAQCKRDCLKNALQDLHDALKQVEAALTYEPPLKGTKMVEVRPGDPRYPTAPYVQKFFGNTTVIHKEGSDIQIGIGGGSKFVT